MRIAPPPHETHSSRAVRTNNAQCTGNSTREDLKDVEWSGGYESTESDPLQTPWKWSKYAGGLGAGPPAVSPPPLAFLQEVWDQ